MYCDSNVIVVLQAPNQTLPPSKTAGRSLGIKRGTSNEVSHILKKSCPNQGVRQAKRDFNIQQMLLSVAEIYLLFQSGFRKNNSSWNVDRFIIIIPCFNINNYCIIFIF